MKKHKRIKKAYLKRMVGGNERRYLIIVDFEGSGGEEELFQEIEAAAVPHLNGIALEWAPLAEWADSVQPLQPFYKKKVFGIF